MILIYTNIFNYSLSTIIYIEILLSTIYIYIYIYIAKYDILQYIYV